jgi:hypothetical protein
MTATTISGRDAVNAGSEWRAHTDQCRVGIAEARVPGAERQPLDEVWHLA